MDFDGGKMESSPEDRGEVIENPEIAQIAAEVEDTYREWAHLLRYPVEDTITGFGDRPDYERAAILDAQGPVVAEFWQRVAEKALGAGLPLPMVNAELAQYHHLRALKLKRKGELAEDQGAEYRQLHARYMFYHEPPNPLVFKIHKELAEERKALEKRLAEIEQEGLALPE